MKEQKRRKGIIDSDEDDGIKVDEATGDDGDDGSSTSTDVENFIVEDDGDIDEEELDRAERMMPSKHCLNITGTPAAASELWHHSAILQAWQTGLGATFPYICKRSSSTRRGLAC